MSDIIERVRNFCRNITYYGFLSLPKYLRKLFIDIASEDETKTHNKANKILGYKQNIDEVKRKAEDIPCVTECHLKLNPHQLLVVGYMLEQRALLV
jgi:hypothetical protein